MSNSQKAATAALAGLTTREEATADQVRGGKHEENLCGQPGGCYGSGG